MHHINRHDKVGNDCTGQEVDGRLGQQEQQGRVQECSDLRHDDCQKGHAENPRQWPQGDAKIVQLACGTVHQQELDTVRTEQRGSRTDKLVWRGLRPRQPSCSNALSIITSGAISGNSTTFVWVT